MRDPRRDALAPSWQRHLERPFPLRLAGEDLDGVDMVMLDADIAGCVTTWLRSSSELDPWRVAVLWACLGDLDRVLPLLTDPRERDYFGCLRDIAVAVLGDHRSSG